MATKRTFIGDRVVDTIPAEKIQKPSDDEISRKEAERLRDTQGLKEGGAATRAGVATRDPEEFDTTHRGGQGNTQPQADPIPPTNIAATPSSHKDEQGRSTQPSEGPTDSKAGSTQSGSTRPPDGPRAAYQTFVGNQPVDHVPPEKLQKPSDDEIARQEAARLSDPEGLKRGGAATRAGVATRDPDEFDTTHRGGQGNTQPQADPVI